MGLNPEEVSSVIKQQLEQYESKLEMKSVGRVLQVGDDQSGSIAVTSAVVLANTATLHLTSKESITGGRITVDNLAMTAGAAIDVTTDVETVASTSGTDTTIRELDDLVIGAVDGETGVTANAGSILVNSEAAGASLTVSRAVEATGTLKDVTFRFDEMAINADITALGDRVTLVQQTDDRPINLGSATSATTSAFGFPRGFVRSIACLRSSPCTRPPLHPGWAGRVDHVF